MLRCQFIIMKEVALGDYRGNRLRPQDSEKKISTTLKQIEVNASGESSEMHGRPLLQSVTTGKYKCATCTGNDCAATC